MGREAKRLERHLARQVANACARHELLAPNDRVLVALSGGKDSYTMLHMLRQHVRSLDFSVSLVAVHLDQKQPGYDGASLVAWRGYGAASSTRPPSASAAPRWRWGITATTASRRSS
jgi:tRNA 2-thiocytidine biosynthesis protein TtcA